LDFITGAAGLLAVAGVGVAAASAYSWINKPQSVHLPFELDNQTLVEVNKILGITVRLLLDSLIKKKKQDTN
jgi:hypothetical protein